MKTKKIIITVAVVAVIAVLFSIGRAMYSGYKEFELYVKPILDEEMAILDRHNPVQAIIDSRPDISMDEVQRLNDEYVEGRKEIIERKINDRKKKLTRSPMTYTFAKGSGFSDQEAIDLCNYLDVLLGTNNCPEEYRHRSEDDYYHTKEELDSLVEVAKASHMRNMAW